MTTNTRRHPRTLQEAFPHGVDYACAVEAPPKHARRWGVGLIVVSILACAVMVAGSARAASPGNCGIYDAVSETLGVEDTATGRHLVWGCTTPKGAGVVYKGFSCLLTSCAAINLLATHLSDEPGAEVWRSRYTFDCARDPLLPQLRQLCIERKQVIESYKRSLRNAKNRHHSM